jgi:UDP-N-acetylglucosamine--N-acetylmuramyl-(pentapeptide) pyrophosphoryl-undecaprenol N-acetylglucosamine transferase
MHFLISCGGTGGHLSPGISLAEGLMARGHTAALLISRKRVDARLSEKYPALTFERMPGRPFSWRPIRMLRCLVSQMGAVIFCLRLIARQSPDAVIGFGGFTSAPMVLAGRLGRIPVALHEANRVPGRATRTLGRFATRVYLPPGIRISSVGAKATRQLGLPVRREIVRLPRAEARAALGLDAGQKVLAILGGSQGASSLNTWARAQVATLAAEGIQVYCLTGLDKGQPEIHEFRARTGAATKAIFVPFCDRMAELLSAADLVVSRAGAGTIAELIRCETPAILVPFPHSTDDHQRANAAFFERQGGGLAVGQAQLGTLHEEVIEAIFNDWLLRKFRSNLRRMDRANSLDLMIRDLENLAGTPASPSAPTFVPA